MKVYTRPIECQGYPKLLKRPIQECSFSQYGKCGLCPWIARALIDQIFKHTTSDACGKLSATKGEKFVTIWSKKGDKSEPIITMFEGKFYQGGVPIFAGDDVVDAPEWHEL